MWSREKTIEWNEIGSKGKYKKRLINKKNNAFRKKTNTYKQDSDNYRVEESKNKNKRLLINIGDNTMSKQNTADKSGRTLINEQTSDLNKSEKMYSWSVQYYFNAWTMGELNPNPIYQRPYHYFDDRDDYWGHSWQKSLISDFLSGKFIQPIHLRLMDDDTYEIIDGGHRSRTLMNFFLNKLKTPEGMELEYKGKIFKIGSMTWKEISKKSSLKELMNKLQFLVIEYSDLTYQEAKDKFKTLNDLHNMCDAEKRNADDSNIAYLNRVLGAVDLSPYAIFNEYDDKGSLNHISMKTIKRQTDELVSTISMWLHYGAKKYLDGGNSNLNKLYKECDESKTKDSVFSKNGKLYKKTFELLGQVNDMVLESDWKKSNWKKMTLQKMSILLDWFYTTVDYKIDNYEIDWKTFVNKVDEINSLPIDEHTPGTRYEIIDNKVQIKEYPKPNKNGKVNKEKYPMESVFGSGNRIDDIEYWLYNIQVRFNMKSFGITRLKDSKRTFNDNQKRQAWVNADFKCQECDKKVTMAEARADHILPHSKGGNTDSSNLQILCEDCNESKSSSMSTNDLQKVLKNRDNLSPEQIKQIAEILA
jgi:hypothetical protein|tara:strand:+ start:59 stop:1819 length:1761 start_codon:yes stop_codon:yes gene_type:complete